MTFKPRSETKKYSAVSSVNLAVAVTVMISTEMQQTLLHVSNIEERQFNPSEFISNVPESLFGLKSKSRPDMRIFIENYSGQHRLCERFGGPPR